MTDAHGNPIIRRDVELGRLYDTLLLAQERAELAGLNVMAKQIRELRRQVHASLVLLGMGSREFGDSTPG